jgi:hypothetical protein
MLLEAQEKQKRGAPGKKYAPPQAVWSAEAELLAKVVDQIELLRLTFISANTEKGKPAPKFVAVPRPVSQTAENLEWERRKAAHDRVVATFLPKSGTIPGEG